MITIKDVARKAGVSIAAVSYALNDKAGVNEDTKRRIKKLAEEMGYVPNSLAQGLLSKKTHVIGLIVPDIANAYTSAFLKYLNLYAHQSSYFLLLGSTSGSVEEEKKVIDSFIGRNVDALIIVPHNYCGEDFYRDVLAKASRKHVPYIFANMNFPGIKSSYVVADFEEGQYAITSYLLRNGYRDFAYIGGSEEHYYSKVKYQGFQRACDEFGLQLPEGRYLDCGLNYTFSEGYRIIKEYTSKRTLPEVFTAVNDLIALGIIKGLSEQGIRVPEDVSVTGFDGLDVEILQAASLTTVRVPLEDMARLCIEILDAGPEQNIQRQIVLQPELVPGSTVKVNLGVRHRYSLV